VSPMPNVHTRSMEGTERSAGGARPGAPERFPFTKFLPPVLDERVVTEDLVARLDAAITQRLLTVLVAPAGSGKTTALAAWAAAARGDVVWIRLGPDDDEPSALATALLEGGRRQLGAGFGTRTAQLLAYAAAAPTARQLVTSLVNDLGDHGAVTLVFDDLHEVTGAALSGFLDQLLEHLPSDVRVVLGSRVEPALSLARRRVRGELSELGLDDLLLDREAIERILAHEGQISDAQVDAVVTASGGWAAAVRLATAHVRADTAVPAPPVSTVAADVLPALSPFLAEEVLDALPDQLRDFLLEVSILDELSPGVCDAVTRRSDSHEILGELDRRNLFVTRHHGPHRDTWRTHDLFAAFLRAQLASRYAVADVQQLHRRAAAALSPFRSLPHLLAAGDHQQAADLIVDLAFSDLDTSTVVQLQPAIRGLPAGGP
jgi:LuxR family transcriptional regulator, maltose regulon positive regulatory protein